MLFPDPRVYGDWKSWALAFMQFSQQRKVDDKRVVLTSPDGKTWVLRVANDGTVTAVVEPVVR